jgi:cell division transport system permease protein
MSRIFYFVRETVISLRRNLLMTLAGIVTVMVALSLVAISLMTRQTVDRGTAKWKNGVEFEIFMTPQASESQIKDISDALDADAEIDTVRFLDKDDAFAQFEDMFRDQPALVAATEKETLPVSFLVAPLDAADTDLLKARYGSRSGVAQINTLSEIIREKAAAARQLRNLAFGLAIATSVAALFLIVNTVRLATYARRREIEVMKLVGASNWFIRVPFLAEGVVQGIVGAGFAVGVAAFLREPLPRMLRGVTEGVSAALSGESGWFLTNSDVMWTATILVVSGAVVGVVASLIGLRSYLDV